MAKGVPPSTEEGARFAPSSEGGGPGRFPPIALTGGGHATGAGGGGGGSDDGLEGLRLLGPVGTLAKAQEWVFVLRSVGLEGVVRPVYSGGWGVVVDEARYERALATVRTYEAENRDFPPVRRKDRPLYAPSWWALATFAALCAFFLVTGPSSGRSPFFRWGTADAELLLHGSPWRAVTALTLHADAQHALGNALGGTLFLSAVNRRLGPGLGTLTVLGAGTAGNVLNALWYGAGHRSIGASTAVFAAVGVLVAVQSLLNRREARGWFATLGPIAGGLVLLGMLGANPNTDVRAHGFGFLAGVALGLPAALIARWRDRPVGSWGQAAFGLLSAGTVVGSWALAFGLRR
ncbi:MAG: rhomboid family intramembrane serine protease [Polyangiaceae bacterium]|nr:rhomboid family intramembrane serine protease [Polyangiaceae bacterium]